MATYTLTMRQICESIAMQYSMKYNTIDQLVEYVWQKIFDFEYPIWDKTYRKELCKKIIKHYFMDEIGLETYDLWHYFLSVKMNEIMPYYNELYKSTKIEFDILSNTRMEKITETKNKSEQKSNDVTNETGENTKNNSFTNEKNINGTSSENKTGTDTTDKNGTNSCTQNRTNDDIRKQNDTPQGSIDNMLDNKYLSYVENSEQTTNENNSSEFEEVSAITYDNSTENKHKTSENEEGEDNSTEKHSGNINSNKTLNENAEGKVTETYRGYNSNPNELIQSYRNNLLNIDMMIIDELEILFMRLF